MPMILNLRLINPRLNPIITPSIKKIQSSLVDMPWWTRKKENRTREKKAPTKKPLTII